MSNEDELKRQAEERRKQIEQQRREEELRRIREEKARQERIDENIKKGRPNDNRPDKDD